MLCWSLFVQLGFILSFCPWKGLSGWKSVFPICFGASGEKKLQVFKEGDDVFVVSMSFLARCRDYLNVEGQT